MKVSGNFGEDTSKAIDRLLNKVDRAMKDTTIELFTSVVAKTPIKTGEAISSYQASVKTPTNGVGIQYFNPNEDTNTDWSRAKAYQLAQDFKLNITPLIYAGGIADNVYLTNDCPYILKLENGGYRGYIYQSEMPPYYVNRTVPFTLTAGGYSKKAPSGMFKLTALEANETFKRNFDKVGV
jgi:hypothetical protein